MNERNHIETLIQMYCTGEKPVLSKSSYLEAEPLQWLIEANIPFTWEVVNDMGLFENKRVIEVRVYLVGNVLYGRSVYTDNEASEAHNKALHNAMKTIAYRDKDSLPVSEPVALESVEQKTQEVKPQMSQAQQANSEKMQPNQALTPDEIMNIVQQNIAPQSQAEPVKITTAEQMRNDQREEIPFDEIDMDTNELNNLLSNKQNTTQPQQQAPGQNNNMSFTQEQINAMVDFRNKNNISNDEIFGSYVNAWNNKLSKKTDITPANVDSFIQWTYTLGKAPY